MPCTGSGFGIRVFSNGSARPRGALTVVADVSNNTVSNVGFDYGILALRPAGRRFSSALRLRAHQQQRECPARRSLDAISPSARHIRAPCAVRIFLRTHEPPRGTGFFGLVRAAGANTFSHVSTSSERRHRQSLGSNNPALPSQRGSPARSRTWPRTSAAAISLRIRFEGGVAPRLMPHAALGGEENHG